MPPTAKGSPARRIREAFFRWEFLRRNKQYQDDYKSLFACDAVALKKARYPRPGYWERLKANEAACGRLVQRHTRWGVAFMANPKWSASIDEMKHDAARRAGNPFWDSR